MATDMKHKNSFIKRTGYGYLHSSIQWCMFPQTADLSDLERAVLPKGGYPAK